MQMPRKTFYAMVNRHGGWIEGDIARFPNVAQKDAFNRECDDYASERKARRAELAETAAMFSAAGAAALSKKEG